MALIDNARPDYGVDAPNVLRNLFLIGIACLLSGILIPRHIHMARSISCPGQCSW